MADKKSLSDLGELTNPTPEGPAAPEQPDVADLPAADAAPARASASPRGQGRRGRDEAPDDHGASTQGPQIQAVLREQQLDKQGRAYATGRRKDAVARVWLKPGSGKIVGQRPRAGSLFRSPDAASGHQPAVRRRRPRGPV